MAVSGLNLRKSLVLKHGLLCIGCMEISLGLYNYELVVKRSIDAVRYS